MPNNITALDRIRKTSIRQFRRQKRFHFHATPMEERERVIFYVTNLIDSREMNAGPDEVFSTCLSVIGEKRAYDLLKPYYPNRLKVSDIRDMGEWGAEKLKREEQLRVISSIFRNEINRLARNLKGRRNRELAKRLSVAAKVFGLSSDELAILEMFYIMQVNPGIDILTSPPFNMTDFQTLQSSGHKILGMNRRNFLSAIKNSSLFNGRLLFFDGDSISITPGIREYLVGFGDRNLDNAYFDRDLKTHLTLSDFGMPAADLKVLKAILQNRKGCNILFYGLPGTGKTSLAACLAKELGLDLYRVKASDEEHSKDFRFQAIYSTMNAAQNNKSVVLVDEADEILNTQSDLMSRSTSSKSWLNSMLDTHTRKVIWITNQTGHIERSSMRRFAFSLEFGKLTIKNRMTVLSYELKKNGLSKFFTQEEIRDLSRRFAVDAGGIVNAVNLLKIKKGMKKENVLELFESVLKNHEKATTGKESYVKPKEIRQYSLDGLNTSHGLDHIVSVLKEFEDARVRTGTQSITLLLYGLPGTGKSEFVHYLGKELGKDVMLKRASDIQDAFVGMTEKNIAQAFREAQDEKSILFFDEADTFLFPRKDAVRSWEKSFTNEILAQLDSFKGVAIFATNDIDGLDHAAIRRFKFKVKFSPLKPEGVMLFYRLMLAPLSASHTSLTREQQDQLMTLRNSTPADFAVVKDQYSFQQQELPTHQALISGLMQEAQHRRTDKTMGF